MQSWVSPKSACSDMQLLCLLEARWNYQNIPTFGRITGVCLPKIRVRQSGTGIKHDIFFILLSLAPQGTNLSQEHWGILPWQTFWVWKIARLCPTPFLGQRAASEASALSTGVCSKYWRRFMERMGGKEPGLCVPEGHFQSPTRLLRPMLSAVS